MKKRKLMATSLALGRRDANKYGTRRLTADDDVEDRKVVPLRAAKKPKAKR
jgi:hypothetical protein